MNRLLGSIAAITCAGALWGNNLVFNPGFDITPWDTGWTLVAAGDGGAEGDSSLWLSLPRSCMIYGYGLVTSNEMQVYQETREAVNCTCRVHYQYVLDAVYDTSYHGTSGVSAEVSISVKIDGGWVEEWRKSVHADSVQPHDHSEDSVWTEWEEVYGPSQEIGGIRFRALGLACDMTPHLASASFWIDDVYVSGEVGIEEGGNRQLSTRVNGQVSDYQLTMTRNPFLRSITISYQVPAKGSSSIVRFPVSLCIYDITGSLVRTLVNEEKNAGRHNVRFSAKNLPAGIYFARIAVGGDLKDSKKLICIK
jgi:hypothetical protein